MSDKIFFSLKYTISFFLVLLSFCRVLAQTEVGVTVILEGGRSYTEKIPAYSLQNKIVILAADVCKSLKITPTATNRSLSITALSKSQKRIILELKGDNHFVKIQNASENKPHRVIQLLSPLILYGDKIYLELEQAALLFGSFLDAQSVADAAAISFNLAEPFSSSAFSDSPITSIARITIPNLTIDEKANGVIVRIVSTKPNLKYEFIPPDKNGIGYLTFVGATGDMRALSREFKGAFLRRVTPRTLRGGSLQLTFEFDAQKYPIKSTDMTREQGTNNFILLALRDANVQEIIDQEKKDEKISSALESDRSKWRLDVITLDAGHGGKDVGAIGATGHYEKDITLAIIKKVGKLIEKSWSDVRVVYTRDSDKFIELDERGKIANRNQSKLFVSVHCNSSPNRSVDGVEVYLLGLHKTDAALKVAQRENAVMIEEADYQERYKNFTDENLIMITMAQSAFVQQSEKLAEIVSRDIARRANRDNRGVKQAGFMVLWTPSMPSILVETGYISNANEEKFLASDDGQTKVAEAIFDGLEKYRKDYEAEVRSE